MPSDELKQEKIDTNQLANKLENEDEAFSMPSSHLPAQTEVESGHNYKESVQSNRPVITGKKTFKQRAPR